MPSRWWIYQQERFPVFAHGPIILAFSLSAMSYSALLRGRSTIDFAAAMIAFATSLLFFLQLRIADEFKDAEDDARWRPYRPVPRGLVTLRQLGLVGAVAAVIQLAGSLWLRPSLAMLLAGAWLYLALMSKEFFVHAWLKAHPAFYMFSHMIILPVFDMYATACDWYVVHDSPHTGLLWFVAVSYCNGIVIEVGRKIRAPEDEEEGVETYSVLWGRPGAIAAWLAAMAMTGLFAWRGAAMIHFDRPVAILLLTLLTFAVLLAVRFLRQSTPGMGKRFELLSGIWSLAMYLSLGAVPLLVAFFKKGLS